MSKVHQLKTTDLYWDAIADGSKTFEVRRNDRAFQTGDILELIKTKANGYYDETLNKDNKWTQQIIRKRVTYILQGGQFGIEPAFCVMGLGEPWAPQ